MGLAVPLQNPDEMTILDLMKYATTFANHPFRFHPMASITSNIGRQLRAECTAPLKKQHPIPKDSSNDSGDEGLTSEDDAGFCPTAVANFWLTADANLQWQEHTNFYPTDTPTFYHTADTDLCPTFQVNC
jgi:hypothetical protein